MGESIIRYRFTEFVHRFVAVASRYEEEIDGNTTIGWPSLAFTPASNGVAARLGSGVVFADEAIRTRDMVANAGRIEGWRLTPSYMLYQQVRGGLPSSAGGFCSRFALSGFCRPTSRGSDTRLRSSSSARTVSILSEPTRRRGLAHSSDACLSSSDRGASHGCEALSPSTRRSLTCPRL